MRNSDNLSGDDHSLDVTLCRAAKQGNIEQLVSCLTNGANVDCQLILDETDFHNPGLKSVESQVKLLNISFENERDSNQSNNKNCSPLQFASELGHVECVKILIDHKANVNQQNDNKWTSLHFAAMNGHSECVNLLIKNNAIVDQISQNLWTPLHFASFYGHVECVEILLNSTADVTKLNIDNLSALHLASVNRKSICLKHLIDNHASVNQKSKDGWTCLHFACFNGDIDCVRILIQHGANVNSQGKDDFAPLHLAAINCHTECAKLLLDSDANVNVEDNNKWTALHFAAVKGHNEFIKLLIQYHPDINHTDKNKWTPLHMACKNGHVESLKMLIENYADLNQKDALGKFPEDYSSQNNPLLFIACLSENERFFTPVIANVKNIQIQDENGQTGLHIACEIGNKEIVRLLIDRNISLDKQRKRDKFSALHIACQKSNKDIVEILLSKNASLFPKSTDGEIPLHISCRTADDKTAELLLTKAKKSYFNLSFIPNLAGFSALHIAARESSNWFLVNLLIQFEFDAKQMTSDGDNALHLACRNDDADSVEALIERVDINAQNKMGNTALHIACDRNCFQTVRCLMRKKPFVIIRNKKGQTPMDIVASSSIKSLLERKPIPDIQYFPLSTERPRGICLILNNEEFDAEVHPTRCGSARDVEDITNLFESFHYSVRSKRNLSIGSMKQEIATLSYDDNHINYDSAVVFLMSHGSKGEIYGTDNMSIKIMELLSHLHRCQSLIGKPKLIFVQACRGSSIDHADSGDRSSNVVDSPKADFLISYGTSTNEVAFRKYDSQGSYFIQTLCDFLRHNNGSKDIQQTLTAVNAEVRKKVLEMENVHQVPDFQSTLSKVFRFTDD